MGHRNGKVLDVANVNQHVVVSNAAPKTKPKAAVKESKKAPKEPDVEPELVVEDKTTKE